MVSSALDLEDMQLVTVYFFKMQDKYGRWWARAICTETATDDVLGPFEDERGATTAVEKYDRAMKARSLMSKGGSA